MTRKEIVDAFLKFLGIILAWPVVVLIVILLAREQLPAAFTDLAGRITEGPLGFKFSEIDEKLDTIAAANSEQAEKVDAIAEQVDRIERSVGFRSSPELTQALEADLRSSLGAFTEYLETVGFTPPSDPVEILVTSDVPNNAYYSPQENLIRIGPALATDPDVAIHEYAQHALTSMLPEIEMTELGIMSGGIQGGLADYYTCSYSGDPRLGETWRPPYIRNLDNEKTLADIPTGQRGSVTLTAAVWGGAFWELRSRLGPERADRALLDAWTETDRMIPSPSTFVERIVTVATNDGGPDMSAEIRDLFENRGLTATVVATPGSPTNPPNS